MLLLCCLLGDRLQFSASALIFKRHTLAVFSRGLYKRRSVVVAGIQVLSVHFSHGLHPSQKSCVLRDTRFLFEDTLVINMAKTAAAAAPKAPKAKKA